MRNEFKTEHQMFVEQEMHHALYGMLLLASGQRPGPHDLEWYDRLAVDLGAQEYQDYVDFHNFKTAN